MNRTLLLFPVRSQLWCNKLGRSIHSIPPEPLELQPLFERQILPSSVRIDDDGHKLENGTPPFFIHRSGNLLGLSLHYNNPTVQLMNRTSLVPIIVFDQCLMNTPSYNSRSISAD